MCKHGSNTLVEVKIPADLSCSGKEKTKKMKIDSCIASIVEALQNGGIDIRGSCCGHNILPGNIELEDGRMLAIFPNRKTWADILNPEIVNIQ